MGFFVGDWGIILSGINYDGFQSKRILIMMKFLQLETQEMMFV